MDVRGRREALELFHSPWKTRDVPLDQSVGRGKMLVTSFADLTIDDGLLYRRLIPTIFHFWFSNEKFSQVTYWGSALGLLRGTTMVIPSASCGISLFEVLLPLSSGTAPPFALEIAALMFRPDLYVCAPQTIAIPFLRLGVKKLLPRKQKIPHLSKGFNRRQMKSN